MPMHTITAAAGPPDVAPVQVQTRLEDGRVRHAQAWEVWVDGPVVLRCIPRPTDTRYYHVLLETMTPIGVGGEKP